MPSNNSLEKHLQERHYNKKYQCKFCDVSFNSVTRLHWHYKKFHYDKKVEIKSICENEKCENIVINYYIDSFVVGKLKKFCCKKCSSSERSRRASKKAIYSKERLEKLVNSKNIKCKWKTIVDKNGNQYKVQGSYEYAFARKLLSMNIEFISHPQAIPYINKDGKKTYYFPDFYLPKFNLYVDTKSDYVFSLSIDKFKLIREQHQDKNILILTKKLLENLYKINLEEEKKNFDNNVGVLIGNN